MLGLRLAPTRLLLPQLGTSVQSRGGAWMGTGSVGVLGGEDMLAPRRFWAVSLWMDTLGWCHARFILAVPQHGV